MNNAPTFNQRILLLYIPWILSILLSYNPVISYFIAWGGSIFILVLTLSGKIRSIPKDLSIPGQFMRPLFLTQIIFSGYTCLTSIFYFSSVLGYDNFQAPINYSPDPVELDLVARCQRFYCLAHAAMSTGILLYMNYSKISYVIKSANIPLFLLRFALVTLPLSILFRLIPGFSQFSNQFNNLSFIAGTLALAYAIPEGKFLNVVICSFLYISNLLNAILSGYKEPIIISIMVLGIFLYPFYKRLVYVFFVPLMFILITILPSYINSFREAMFSGDFNAEEASTVALENLNNQSEDEKEETNWDFVTGRLSEIGMFTKYTRSTPEIIDYYGFEIVKQSIIVIVPRLFWPKKPITEDMVMERVYTADVVERGQPVSAKPQVVVDAYLSGGSMAIFITFLIYGALAQYISVQSERLFGGYLGTALIYTGLFQMFWRGLTFEFLINSVFWSAFTMVIIFGVFKQNRILIKRKA